MINIKTISAVMILSAAIATPVFAQDASVSGPEHVRTHHDRNYRGAYNEVSGSNYASPRTQEEDTNLQNFGFSGRDPSRVGGEDPDLKPSN